MPTLKKLVQQVNAENAPPDGWTPQDQLQDKPEEGKVYALTGGPGSKCIANGFSWADSEVTDGAAPRDTGTSSRSSR